MGKRRPAHISASYMTPRSTEPGKLIRPLGPLARCVASSFVATEVVGKRHCNSLAALVTIQAKSQHQRVQATGALTQCDVRHSSSVQQSLHANAELIHSVMSSDMKGSSRAVSMSVHVLNCRCKTAGKTSAAPPSVQHWGIASCKRVHCSGPVYESSFRNSIADSSRVCTREDNYSVSREHVLS